MHFEAFFRAENRFKPLLEMRRISKETRKCLLILFRANFIEMLNKNSD